MIEAWNSDDNDGYDDDKIDNFTASFPSTAVVEFGQSNQLMVQGETGLGNFTLTYYNLTTVATLSNSRDDLTYSTSCPALEVHVSNKFDVYKPLQCF